MDFCAPGEGAANAHARRDARDPMSEIVNFANAVVRCAEARIVTSFKVGSASHGDYARCRFFAHYPV